MKFMALAASVLMLGAGAAQAQVSDADYPKYYDYIIQHNWYCLLKQPFSEVQSGEMQTNVTLQFRPKNSYEAYRFVGSGTQVATVEGRDYNARFTMEGFGVNESGFGTGISIKTLTVTSGDTLPRGWTWDGSEDVQLHLVETADAYPYELQGYDIMGGSTRIDWRCIVDDR